jgi:signal transduction histidine kinase
VFDQYLTTTQIPALEYREEGQTLWYRWADEVTGFDLPVRVRLEGPGYTLLRPTEEWQTTAIADPSADVRAEFSGVDSYEDFGSLLRERSLDLICIATPTELHASQAIAALQAGRHVLLEKPMATSIADAQRINAAAQRAGKVLLVGHSHSYDAPIAQMRAIVESGELGAPCMANTWAFTDWVYRPRRPEELDVAEVLRDICARFTPEARSSGSDLAFESPETVAATLDRTRMEQVASNLVVNAIKYGKGNPILVKLEQSEDKIVILVQDQGLGISTADQARIFERFEQVNRHAGSAGLGLGLYITKQIVDAQGGKISVSSEPGRGSTLRRPTSPCETGRSSGQWRSIRTSSSRGGATFRPAGQDSGHSSSIHASAVRGSGGRWSTGASSARASSDDRRSASIRLPCSRTRCACTSGWGSGAAPSSTCVPPMSSAPRPPTI